MIELLNIFEFFFYVGLFCSVLMFFLGNILDVSGLDGPADTQIEIHFLGNSIVSPFKPITVLSFCTVFGGSGILLSNRYPPLVSFLIALSLAFLTAGLLYKFFLIPLYKAGEKGLAITQADLIGRTGVVNLTIPPNQLGSVTYLVRDYTCTSPACSVDGEAIEEGSRVEIISIEDNILNVRKI